MTITEKIKQQIVLNDRARKVGEIKAITAQAVANWHEKRLEAMDERNEQRKSIGQMMKAEGGE